MKKAAIYILSALTLLTVTACGCGKTVEKDNPTEMQIIEDDDCAPECPECPEDQKPEPRTPHIRHGHKLPRPKSAYVKR